MSQILFDPDALRSFATGMALGSYAKAADRLGRSTSAVSAQLKKLEMQAGTDLFRKAGRGLALTEAGETLLAYAHRLLDLNEEAAAALRSANLQGLVRLGLQEDFGEALLPAVLGRFARAHPKVRLEVCVARSAELREKLALRQIDLALVWEAGEQTPLPHGETLLSAPLQWLAAADVEEMRPAWLESLHGGSAGALPLILLDAPCPLRELAAGALASAGIPWHHAFTSASLAALWAATSAGLGVAVRTPIGLPASVRPIDAKAWGLPPLPKIGLALYHCAETPEAPVAELAALLKQAVAQA
ncbi:MAG TPA: LysR substrate-binding domain-containing protein [Rhodocyclaceae bacterium]|nr:LysR substrate-binding domain-containing protein [Rhodocyclaceae bacterium]